MISRLLGRGVRSATYLAEHRSLHRDVVVKILDNPWAGDTAAASRFDQAARSLSMLEAANIAALIDSGREPGRGIFVVTEFVEGDSLEDFLGERGALTLEEFVPIAAQILKGLGAAHLRGLLHLDITLDNIYISKDDAVPTRGRIRLLDLGLVQLVEGHVQGHVQGIESSTTGDTRYLAPEQISDKPLDTRTDVYAVGALFYQMLAGLPPFTGTDAQIIYKHINERPSPLADEVDEALPEELIELIEKCLSKDPDDRPVDANEIVELLIDAVPASLFRGPVAPPHSADDAEDMSDALVDEDSDAHARVAAPVLGVGLTETHDEGRSDSSDSGKRPPAIGDLALEAPRSPTKGWSVADDPAAASSGGAAVVHERAAEATPPEEDKEDKGGFIVIVLLVVAVIVGGIYLFKPEILGLAPPVTRPPITAQPTPPADAPADIGTLLSKARALETNGDTIGASAIYHQILALDPTHPEASARLAALSSGGEEAASTGGLTGSSTGPSTGGSSGSTGGSSGSTGATTGGESASEGSTGGMTTSTSGSTGGSTTAAPDAAPATADVEFIMKARGKLFVDGKKVGKVPGTLNLPTGMHTLRIEGSSRHKPWEDKIEIKAGMEPLKIRLKRIPKDLSGENIDIDPMLEGPETPFSIRK